MLVSRMRIFRFLVEFENDLLCLLILHQYLMLYIFLCTLYTYKFPTNSSMTINYHSRIIFRMLIVIDNRQLLLNATVQNDYSYFCLLKISRFIYNIASTYSSPQSRIFSNYRGTLLCGNSLFVASTGQVLQDQISRFNQQEHADCSVQINIDSQKGFLSLRKSSLRVHKIFKYFSPYLTQFGEQVENTVRINNELRVQKVEGGQRGEEPDTFL